MQHANEYESSSGATTQQGVRKGSVVHLAHKTGARTFHRVHRNLDLHDISKWQERSLQRLKINFIRDAANV